MANLTEQKLKEMEAEMSRFEEEISGSTPAGGPFPSGPSNRMIIGSSTYSQVAAQLCKDDAPGPPQSTLNIPISVAAAPPPPPPPPPTTSAPPAASSLHLPPPPPPPPLGRPAFMPPQLRRGPPMPRPPMPPPPMGMPHRPAPPMMGMRQPPPLGGLPPPPPPGNPAVFSAPPSNYYNHRPPETPKPQPQPPIIEKPKVVYSAAPVRNVPPAKKQKVSPAVTVTKAKEVEEKVEEAPKAEVAAGIEVNVPVHEVEVNRIPVTENTDGVPMPQEVTERKEKKEKKKKFIRTAAGQVWEDQTLTDWDTDDFRLFAGDLGNEVTDETLSRAFSKYPSFQKAKVIRDKRTNKTRGFGFISFKDPNDFVKAMREMNGKYVGNRPIKLRKSSWKERQIDVVRKKDKEKKRLGFR